MKEFSDFNIKPNSKAMTGEKIKIARVLNVPIEVHDYRIEKSKFDKGAGEDKCLYLQIKLGNEMRVVFTGSTILMDMIERVPEADFPFKTTIKENNEGFEFT